MYQNMPFKTLMYQNMPKCPKSRKYVFICKMKQIIFDYNVSINLNLVQFRLKYQVTIKWRHEDPSNNNNNNNSMEKSPSWEANKSSAS
jgi:hypothetical protein